MGDIHAPDRDGVAAVEPLNWAKTVVDAGVTERDFELSVAGQAVPGAAWSPEGTDHWPTILLGHGGTQHRRTSGLRAVARRLALHLGFGAVAIDAPEHGDRRRQP